MHIRSILAIARKDALDILLNKATLTLLLSPILLAVLFVVIIIFRREGILGSREVDLGNLFARRGETGKQVDG